MPNSIISMEGTPVNTPGHEFYSFGHHENVKDSMMSMGAPYVYSTPIKKTYKRWPFVVVAMCASVIFAVYIFYQLPEYRLNVRYDLYKLFGSHIENAEWVNGHREIVPFVFLFTTVGIPTLIGGVTLAVGNALPPVPMGMHRTIFRFLKRKALVGRVNASYAEGVLALLFLGMNAIWFAAIFGRKTNELAAQGALDGASRLQTMGYAFGFNAVLCFSLLILPATRNCFWMISMGIDYSHAIKYHRWIGFFTVFSVLAHAIPYYKKWISEGTYIKNAMPCIKCESGDPENRQRLQNFMGQMALLACLIMGVTSLPVVRRRYYEIFYYSHHLFIVVLCATVIHFSSFIIWMYPSICLYMMHRILSRSQSAVPCEVVDMEAIPGEITRLVFRRSPGKPGHYHAGQFVYLRVPLLSHTQWHPFSISSSPIEYEDTFTVHVKAIGNWTKELFAVAIQAHEERNVPLIYVDGYYGKMSDDFQHYPVLVMVAGGIGATPIISMIGKILDCMRNNDPVMLNTIVYWHWTSREIGIFHEFEPLLDAIQEYDPDQVRFRVRLCFTGDQHLGGVDIPNGITLKPMDDTSMIPTRPFYQSARSAPYQMLLFFVTFTASFAALLVMRMNYPLLGTDRTHQNMWPLQRFLELVVLLVGATLGWLVATAESKPRTSSRQEQAGGAGETNPFLLDERESERSSTYSHTLSFDGQEVQFKHPVSRTRLNVKELMADVVKEQSYNFAVNVTGIGTWVSGPISLIHAVETEAAAFAGIFDVHYEEFEM